MCEAIKEVIWLERLIKELTTENWELPILYIDNQSAIRLIKNPEFHQRTKHIDVKYCFIREKYNEKLFEIRYICSEQQQADLLTSK